MDSKGQIYILDANRVLKFSQEGRYLCNFVRKGEGPGEVTGIGTFLIQKDRIMIFNAFPPKVMLKNTEGKLIKEMRFPEGAVNAKIIDLDYLIYRLSDKKNLTLVEAFKFPLKTFMVKQSGIWTISIGELIYTHLLDELYCISHTPEYQIKILNLKNKKVVKTITKEYQRQESPEQIAKKLNAQGFMFVDKVYRRPPQKYLNDVQLLVKYKNQLWVVTSTVDKHKGVLVDAFSKEGGYIENFFLRLSDRIKHMDYYNFWARIFDDHLYTVENDSEDNPYIVKYKIIRE